MSRLILILVLIFAACGKRAVNEDGGPPISKKPSALDCPTIAPQRAFDKLAPDVQDASLSACGHLQFIDGDGQLYLSGPDLLAPQAVAVGRTRARFAPAGDLLLHSDGEQLHARDLKTGATHSTALAPGHAEFHGVRGSATRTDIVVCDKGGLTIAAPDFTARYHEPDVDCGSLTGEPFGSVVVYAQADGALRRVDLASATVDAIPGVTFYGISHPEGGRDAQDRLYLLPEGVLIHHRHWTESCGDTVCGVEAEVTLIATDDLRALGTAPVGPNPCCGHFGELDFINDAQTLVFQGLQETIWVLDETRALKTVAGSEPLQILGDGQLLLRANVDNRSHVVRVDPTSGSSSDLGYGDSVRVSANEQSWAVGHFIPERCVFYPDRPNTCHKQLWGVTRHRDGEVRLLAEGSQPLQPLWSGDDGRVLLAGGLANVPLPEVIAPENFPEEPYAIHLLDPEGKKLASFDWDTRGLAIWPVGELLLVKRRGDNWQEVLEIVDPRTGEHRSLVSGHTLEISFDAARTRLAVIADVRVGDDVYRELWAGQMPKP